jgi:hypothetical protein
MDAVCGVSDLHLNQKESSFAELAKRIQAGWIGAFVQHGWLQVSTFDEGDWQRARR